MCACGSKDSLTYHEANMVCCTSKYHWSNFPIKIDARNCSLSFTESCLLKHDGTESSKLKFQETRDVPFDNERMERINKMRLSGKGYNGSPSYMFRHPSWYDERFTFLHVDLQKDPQAKSKGPYTAVYYCEQCLVKENKDFPTVVCNECMKLVFQNEMNKNQSHEDFDS